ncbi:unnamed protein product, partial [Discosporangium mesarthrocarpum]
RKEKGRERSVDSRKEKGRERSVDSRKEKGRERSVDSWREREREMGRERSVDSRRNLARMSENGIVGGEHRGGKQQQQSGSRRAHESVPSETPPRSSLSGTPAGKGRAGGGSGPILKSGMKAGDSSRSMPDLSIVLGVVPLSRPIPTGSTRHIYEQGSGEEVKPALGPGPGSIPGPTSGGTSMHSQLAGSRRRSSVNSGETPLPSRAGR